MLGTLLYVLASFMEGDHILVPYVQYIPVSSIQQMLQKCLLSKEMETCSFCPQ